MRSKSALNYFLKVSAPHSVVALFWRASFFNVIGPLALLIYSIYFLKENVFLISFLIFFSIFTVFNFYTLSKKEEGFIFRFQPIAENVSFKANLFNYYSYFLTPFIGILISGFLISKQNLEAPGLFLISVFFLLCFLALFLNFLRVSLISGRHSYKTIAGTRTLQWFSVLSFISLKNRHDQLLLKYQEALSSYPLASFLEFGTYVQEFKNAVYSYRILFKVNFDQYENTCTINSYCQKESEFDWTFLKAIPCKSSCDFENISEPSDSPPLFFIQDPALLEECILKIIYELEM